MKRLIVTILALFIVFEVSRGSRLATYHEEDFSMEELVPDEFSQANLQQYIAIKGLKHPEIVYAQAVLETGNFSSTIFKENNNLFGMKYVHDCRCSRTRPTTADGSKYGHAYYSDKNKVGWKKSVDDYLLWQQMFKITPIETQAQYLAVLDWKYCQSGVYSKVLKRIMAEQAKINS
jgi:mannosyl-glycoprotein endo-beta-N-acetylglucosaminidase